MGKPGDFFVGVTDLFSVLLPGAIVAYLIRLAEGSELDTVLGVYRLSEVQSAAAFLVAAFILGHLTDMAGAAVLDRIYDLTYADYKRFHDGLWRWVRMSPGRVYARLKDDFRETFGGLKGPPTPTDPLLDAAKALIPELPPGERVYQWCRDWLQVYRPQTLVESDRTQANSKFFRALVVLTVLFAALLMVDPAIAAAFAQLAPRLVLLMLSCVVALAAFLRYSDLRWKAVHHVYRLYVISRQAGPQPAPGAPEAAHDEG